MLLSKRESPHVSSETKDRDFKSSFGCLTKYFVDSGILSIRKS
jgi:hypothetical protein